MTVNVPYPMKAEEIAALGRLIRGVDAIRAARPDLTFTQFQALLIVAAADKAP